MPLKILRQTIKKLPGKKLQKHVEEINNVGNTFHRVTRNYLGSRLTRRNVGRVTKKNLQKILNTVKAEQKKTASFFNTLFL
jgi:hypothetical protein